jgi:hypothetical protein
MSSPSQKANKPAPKTKGEKVIALLQRKTGASISELAKATGWQSHSVQGFMSGTLKKKRCLSIISTKNDNTDRRYFIAEQSK